MAAKLIWITPEAEAVIGYCARVSNPQNQDNKEVKKLLAYCIKHEHWSIFEQASACIEITTSRAISGQILRHKSFSFQEFSQRYAESINIINYNCRRQDEKNRQNSTDDLPASTKEWWQKAQQTMRNVAFAQYKTALQLGIAKECARMLLPMATETRLYMTGTIRSWLHYINVRCTPETQLEHREVAIHIRDILYNNLPIIRDIYQGS